MGGCRRTAVAAAPPRGLRRDPPPSRGFLGGNPGSEEFIFDELEILFYVTGEEMVHEIISVIASFTISRMFDLLTNNKCADNKHNRKSELEHNQYFSWRNQCMCFLETSF